MVREVVWTGAAKKDLRSIYDYISNDSKGYAAAVVNGLITAGDSLRDFPLRGNALPELPEQPGMRQLLVGQYRLLYLVEEERVYILAAIHTSRDLAGDILGTS